MKISFFLCLFASMLGFGAGRAVAEPALQYHCGGGSQLGQNTGLAALHKALALPATTNLQNLARTRFSTWLTSTLALTNNPSSALMLEPLVGDVAENESLGSFGGASSFILALHLDATRAQAWQDTLAKIFGGGGETFACKPFSGRRWNVAGSHSFWIIPARDWLLVGCGDDFSPAQAQYLSQIQALGRPVPALKEHWLEADMTTARLGGWFRLLQPARIRMTITPNGDGLQIGARVIETQAIPWKSGPWQIPGDLMRGQIISFTAGQNVAAFLNVNPALSRLPGNPLTNQFYFWAGDQMPFLNYMAWPEADASNVLNELSTQAPAALNPILKRFNGTELVWHPEARQLSMQNIRLFVPALEAVQAHDGPFLLLSSFPRTPGNAAPDALLSQIKGRTNLVAYDWELTGRRLSELQILGGMIANRACAQKSEGEDYAEIEMKWLEGLVPLGGATVTEITRVAPNELSVTRQAPVGLTAVELTLFADWLCDANAGPIYQ